LLAPELAAPVIARLKVLASLDIAEHRLPQDGQFALNLAGRPLSFRIATLPCRYGEKIVLRLLHQVDQALDLEALGLSSSQLAAFRQALNQPQGLLLVTGPTGSGKTVTLYSALQARNREQVNICSVEDPLEIPIAGMNQTQINPRAGLTFHSVLRALLRQDPDIVMVGEIRDAETAEIALKAAQTGHLVLSTLHTNSAPESIARLLEIGLDPFNFSELAARHPCAAPGAAPVQGLPRTRGGRRRNAAAHGMAVPAQRLGQQPRRPCGAGPALAQELRCGFWRIAALAPRGLPGVRGPRLPGAHGHP